jgi:hypothetical protein
VHAYTQEEWMLSDSYIQRLRDEDGYLVPQHVFYAKDHKGATNDDSYFVPSFKPDIATKVIHSSPERDADGYLIPKSLPTSGQSLAAHKRVPNFKPPPIPLTPQEHIYEEISDDLDDPPPLPQSQNDQVHRSSTQGTMHVYDVGLIVNSQ